jgi:hypothetical protein
MKTRPESPLFELQRALSRVLLSGNPLTMYQKLNQNKQICDLISQFNMDAEIQAILQKFNNQVYQPRSLQTHLRGYSTGVIEKVL